MVAIQEAVTYALSLPEAIEMPHFEKRSFRVGKKIFATLNEPKQQMVVKLNEIDQSVFSVNKTVIYPLANAWGKQGWTVIELKKVRKSLFKDAIQVSYNGVALKKKQKNK